MGVKPLYFNGGREGFVFASELKALVACGQVTASLDVLAPSRYLGFLWSPGGATPIVGVSRLGPGEALRVKDGRVVNRWRWAHSAWAATPSGLGTTDPIRAVRERLRTAVHRQMCTCGPFLSGGSIPAP
jgi:asparagine synthase (glutamine-hydrolysing)